LYGGWLINSMFLPVKYWVVWTDVWEHCHDEEWFCIASCFFLFLQGLLANKWLCIIQNWPFYDPLALSPHIHLSKKKNRWPFVSSANNCWIWLILEDPYSRLLFIFGLMCVDPRFVTCIDVIHGFWLTMIIFF